MSKKIKKTQNAEAVEDNLENETEVGEATAEAEEKATKELSEEEKTERIHVLLQKLEVCHKEKNISGAKKIRRTLRNRYHYYISKVKAQIMSQLAEEGATTK